VLPIWLGVQGERVGLRMAAEMADGWNFSGVGDLEDFRRKRGVLMQFAESAGRDPAEIEISAQLRMDPAAPDAALATCTAFVEAGCEHVILYLDPRAGPDGLARLAADVVQPLRRRFGSA